MEDNISKRQKGMEFINFNVLNSNLIIMKYGYLYI